MNFTKWLRAARPGQAFVYHTGLLMADRQREANADFEAVDMAGRLAWRAHEAGRVTLTQVRIDKHSSAYIATRL